MMTKKDFAAIARIIRTNEVYDPTTHRLYVVKEHLVRALCDLFAEQNPRFDATRFCDACTNPTEPPVIHTEQN